MGLVRIWRCHWREEELGNPLNRDEVSQEDIRPASTREWPDGMPWSVVVWVAQDQRPGRTGYSLGLQFPCPQRSFAQL